MTGLTSNPTIFDHAIKNSNAYDSAIRKKRKNLKSSEELFFELALEDINQGRRPVSTDLGEDQRRGRVGVVGSIAAAGP